MQSIYKALVGLPLNFSQYCISCTEVDVFEAGSVVKHFLRAS